jgi:hypothetical protein
MRYLDCGKEVYNMLNEVQDEFFEELRSAKIKCLFDTKKRKSRGKIRLADIRKTNDLLRHLTSEEAKTEDGFDYILTIDKKVWEHTEEIDRKRLIRHELRHTFVDGEAKDPYKLVPHDIEDFVEEVKLNSDDPGWANRVASMISDIYEQEKDDAKEKTRSRGKSLKRVRK